MTSGIVFGLSAALCWGVADFCARGATRAGGTFLTLLSIQVIAVLAFLLLAAPLELGALLTAPKGAVLAAAGINLAIMAGAGLLYRAFAIGTVALVSPVAASFAAITALLALASGERPTSLQLAGIVLTLGGVILASAAPGVSLTADVRDASRLLAGGKRWWAPQPGLFEALAAMLMFGVGYWAQRFVVAALGGIMVAFVAKVADLIVLCALALFGVVALRARGSKSAARRWYALGRPSAAFWRFVIPTALLDTAANIAYNVGIAHALTTIVVVLASLFSAVTVLLAWSFLRERLARWQLAGVAAILAGIALVSV